VLSEAQMIIRPLEVEELSRVNEIDVSETGATVYRQVGRRLELTLEEWQRPPNSKERWDHQIEGWIPMLRRGGCALGAFAGDTLVGIAVFRPRLTRSMAQLAALFVSKQHRRLHIATHLTEEVIRLARQSGARALYVSATPSESAFGFYLSQGFAPTQNVNKELFELEPEDIHMIKPP
jgi:GNAT superfamily N-acetyltransferase